MNWQDFTQLVGDLAPHVAPELRDDFVDEYTRCALDAVGQDSEPLFTLPEPAPINPWYHLLTDGRLTDIIPSNLFTGLPDSDDKWYGEYSPDKPFWCMRHGGGVHRNVALNRDEPELDCWYIHFDGANPYDIAGAIDGGFNAGVDENGDCLVSSHEHGAPFLAAAIYQIGGCDALDNWCHSDETITCECGVIHLDSQVTYDAPTVIFVENGYSLSCVCCESWDNIAARALENGAIWAAQRIKEELPERPTLEIDTEWRYIFPKSYDRGWELWRGHGGLATLAGWFDSHGVVMYPLDDTVILQSDSDAVLDSILQRVAVDDGYSHSRWNCISGNYDYVHVPDWQLDHDLVAARIKTHRMIEKWRSYRNQRFTRQARLARTFLYRRENWRHTDKPRAIMAIGAGTTN